jgi:hypothetical protein
MASSRAKRLWLEKLQDLECIAFADPAQAFDKEGKLLPLEKIPEDLRKAIASYDVEERIENRDGRMVSIVATRVTFRDKGEAFRKLLGAVNERDGRSTRSDAKE